MIEQEVPLLNPFMKSTLIYIDEETPTISFQPPNQQHHNYIALRIHELLHDYKNAMKAFKKSLNMYKKMHGIKD